MKIKSLNCPNCNYSIDLPKKSGPVECPACGSVLQYDDGKIHVVDEAELARIEFQREQLKRMEATATANKEAIKNWHKKACIAYGAFFVYMLLMRLLNKVAYGVLDSPVGMVFGIIAIALFIGGILYIVITRPDDCYIPPKKPFIQSKILFGIAMFFVFQTTLLFMSAGLN